MQEATEWGSQVLYLRVGSGLACAATFLTPHLALTSSKCGQAFRAGTASLSVATFETFQAAETLQYAKRYRLSRVDAPSSVLRQIAPPPSPAPSLFLHHVLRAELVAVYPIQIPSLMTTTSAHEMLGTLVRPYYDTILILPHAQIQAETTPIFFTNPERVEIDGETYTCEVNEDGKPYDPISYEEIEEGEYFIPLRDHPVTHCYSYLSIYTYVETYYSIEQEEGPPVLKHPSGSNIACTQEELKAMYYLFEMHMVAKTGGEIPERMQRLLVPPFTKKIYVLPRDRDDWVSGDSSRKMQITKLNPVAQCLSRRTGKRCDKATASADAIIDRWIHAETEAYKGTANVDHNGGLVFIELSDGHTAMLGVYDGGADREGEPTATTGHARILPIQDALLQRCLSVEEDRPRSAFDVLESSLVVLAKAPFHEQLDCVSVDENRGDTGVCGHHSQFATGQYVIAYWFARTYSPHAMSRFFGATTLFVVSDGTAYGYVDRVDNDVPVSVADEEDLAALAILNAPESASDGDGGRARGTRSRQDQLGAVKTQAALHVTFKQLAHTFTRHGNEYRCLSPYMSSRKYDEEQIEPSPAMKTVCVRKMRDLNGVDHSFTLRRYVAVALYFEECDMREMETDFNLGTIVEMRERFPLGDSYGSQNRDAMKAESTDAMLECGLASLATSTSCDAASVPAAYTRLSEQRAPHTDWVSPYGFIKEYDFFLRSICSFGSDDLARPAGSVSTSPTFQQHLWKFQPQAKASTLCSALYNIRHSSQSGVAHPWFVDVHAMRGAQDDGFDARQQTLRPSYNAFLGALGYGGNDVCAALDDGGSVKVRVDSAYMLCTPGDYRWGFLDGRKVLSKECVASSGRYRYSDTQCARERSMMEHICARTGCPPYMFDYVGYIDAPGVPGEESGDEARYMLYSMESTYGEKMMDDTCPRIMATSMTQFKTGLMDAYMRGVMAGDEFGSIPQLVAYFLWKFRYRGVVWLPDEDSAAFGIQFFNLLLKQDQGVVAQLILHNEFMYREYKTEPVQLHFNDVETHKVSQTDMFHFAADVSLPTTADAFEVMSRLATTFADKLTIDAEVAEYSSTLFTDPYRVQTASGTHMCDVDEEGKPYDPISYEEIKEGEYFIPLRDFTIIKCYSYSSIYGLVDHFSRDRERDHNAVLKHPSGSGIAFIQEELRSMYYLFELYKQIPPIMYDLLEEIPPSQAELDTMAGDRKEDARARMEEARAITKENFPNMPEFGARYSTLAAHVASYLSLAQTNWRSVDFLGKDDLGKDDTVSAIAHSGVEWISHTGGADWEEKLSPANSRRMFRREMTVLAPSLTNTADRIQRRVRSALKEVARGTLPAPRLVSIPELARIIQNEKSTPCVQAYMYLSDKRAHVSMMLAYLIHLTSHLGWYPVSSKEEFLNQCVERHKVEYICDVQAQITMTASPSSDSVEENRVEAEFEVLSVKVLGVRKNGIMYGVPSNQEWLSDYTTTSFEDRISHNTDTDSNKYEATLSCIERVVDEYMKTLRGAEGVAKVTQRVIKVTKEFTIEPFTADTFAPEFKYVGVLDGHLFNPLHYAVTEPPLFRSTIPEHWSDFPTNPSLPPIFRESYRKYVTIVHHIIVQIASALHHLHTVHKVVHNNLIEESIYVYRRGTRHSGTLDVIVREAAASETADEFTIRLGGFDGSYKFEESGEDNRSPNVLIHIAERGVTAPPDKASMDGRKRDIFMLGKLAYQLLFDAAPTFQKNGKCEAGVSFFRRLMRGTHALGEESMHIHSEPFHQICLPKHNWYFLLTFLSNALSDIGLSAAEALRDLSDIFAGTLYGTNPRQPVPVRTISKLEADYWQTASSEAWMFDERGEMTSIHFTPSRSAFNSAMAMYVYYAGGGGSDDLLSALSRFGVDAPSTMFENAFKSIPLKIESGFEEN